MIEMNKPMVVKIHDVNVDQEYVQWIAELKVRYRSAQSKAAVCVNAEQQGGRGQVPGTGADTGNQILCMNPRPIPVSLSN